MGSGANDTRFWERLGADVEARFLPSLAPRGFFAEDGTLLGGIVLGERRGTSLIPHSSLGRTRLEYTVWAKSKTLERFHRLEEEVAESGEPTIFATREQPSKLRSCMNERLS